MRVSFYGIVLMMITLPACGTFAHEDTGLDPLPVLPSQYVNSPTALAGARQKASIIELRARESDSSEIERLRQKAQALVGGMTDLISLQTVTQSNRSFQKQLVRVSDGKQVFVLPDGREVSSMPDPKGPFVVPGSLWRDLPETVGTDHHLPIRYLGERTESGYLIKVFHFEATAEDQICSMRVKKFWKDWIGTVPCHGEVWTDEDLNILRISEQMELPPKSGLESCSVTILYGWLRHGHLAARLVPASMHLITWKHGSLCLESSVIFSGYHQFHSSTKIMAASRESGVPALR